ncbi:MAG: cellulase family glycosylhydrolase [Anaerolineales bacterium]|nr:cellulase family glycosylhydrolase [Anaerolineales bacterium]
MKKRFSRPAILIIGLSLLAACRTATRTVPTEVTPDPGVTIAHSSLPEVTATPVGCTCTTLAENWESDWPATLAALDCLTAHDQTCGEEPLSSKKYAARYNYAVSLEIQGDLDAAIVQYQAAFLIDAARGEALNALVRLDALPEPTPPTCLSSFTGNDPSPVETPDIGSFVQVRGDQFWLNEHPFTVRGVNYYPRHAPWHKFLTEAEFSEIEIELDLIRQAGFNTIRVFLWHEPLFTCNPDEAIPNEAVFARIDAFLNLAGERDLKLIVTLNDLPDLLYRPLYIDWAHYDAQIVYIVRRYRNEAGIVAWDLRNEGDLDYGARTGDDARFSQQEVIDWVAHAGQLVRENDPYHLITAGWWGDPAITGPYVDFLSFHHWSGAPEIEARLDEYKQRTEKPLLLEEIGYHSWAGAPQGARDEVAQAELLAQAIGAVENQGIAGWMVWTAFDFAVEPGQTATYENYFGLWSTDLDPKPALDVLPLH